MVLQEEQLRLIFGLKLRQIRTERGYSLFGLSKKTGLSKSYLNEIEKGKKYPKPDKILNLANALSVDYDEMVSMKLGGTMAPLSDIILSGILKEIPLELFGIEENNLIDIIAGAPEKVSAFISTLFEIARHYKVGRENFYLAALRSYQESHQNYFPDLEQAARDCALKYQINLEQLISSQELVEILEEEFQYLIDQSSLSEEKLPESVRSLFIPSSKKLLLASHIPEAQKVFILAKELGYAYLGISERPLSFTWIKFDSFEEVLNNFKASYFAGALCLPENRLKDRLKSIFAQETWDNDAWISLMSEFTNSAETFYQRLTNLLPAHFGLNKLFFLRLVQEENGIPILNKELHLSRQHQSKALAGTVNYCRRWLSTDLLINSENYRQHESFKTGAQISVYHDTGEAYLMLGASDDDPIKKGAKRSVAIGILINPNLKKKIKFVQDDSLKTIEVGTSCESCAITDCDLRVCPAHRLERQKKAELLNAQIQGTLEKYAK